MQPCSFTEVYRDEHFLAVDKPAGLLCVPGLVSPDNLHDRVKQVHPNARVVHRLDMATSGLVLFALSYESQKRLGRIFHDRQITKRYRARVHGALQAQWGEICLPLLCDWENRPRQKVCWRQGKTALTRFRLESVDAERNSSFVTLFPATGRTHQLRVHMQALGHPIVGDDLYAANDDGSTRRLMLHAESLHFEHPFLKIPLELEAPSPF